MTSTIEPTSTPVVARAPRRAPMPVVGLDEMVAALRAIPHGGLDDCARRFAAPPAMRALVSPLVVVLRWTAVLVGLVAMALRPEGVTGDAVLTLAVCVPLAVWRTVLPLKLGSRRQVDRTPALVDAALVGAAIGWSGAWDSPFAAVPVVAVALASFGWGYREGAGSAASSAGAALVTLGLRTATLDGTVITGGLRALIAVVALAAAVAGAGYARDALLEAEHRRRAAGASMDALVETNDLLAMLNVVAARLPASLNVRDAIDSVREQVTTTFAPSVVCLLAHDEQHGEWIPKLAEGCVLRPSFTTDDLPPPLRRTLDVPGTVLAASFHDSGIAPASGSGMYVRLQIRERVVGLLGVEHPRAGHYGHHHAALLDDLADGFALMLDNAVRYGRLRSLGTEEERTRIARELHDRLGQWLTYVGFELERITDVERPSAAELGNLRADVDHALEELRETLRQLRSEVTVGQPLAVVGAELLERFRRRTDLHVEWRVSDPDSHLPVPVENELLRILLESLSNIDRHAEATHVVVSWEVRNGIGTLRITDDGRGFEPEQVVRDNAYGLVGMRERAGVIGARLTIDSAPGRGTTIAVTTGATDTQEI